MNTIKLMATFVAFASAFSFAGKFSYFPYSGKTSDNYNWDLAKIDSLTFKKSNNVQQIILKNHGKTLKTLNADSIAALGLSIENGSKEFLVVHPKNNQQQRDTIMLNKIRFIEVYSMDSNVDSDNDSISDFEEKFKYETNPWDSDTDGDGWSDKEEIMKFNAKYPLSWNPKIADIPKLSMELVRTPDIFLNVTTNENETQTQSTSLGESQAASFVCTKGGSITSSVQTTLTNKMGISTSMEFGGTGIVKTNLGFSADLTSALASSSTRGASWSEANTKTLTKNYNKAETESQSQGKSISGSSIFMQLKLKNTGNIAYNVENISVAASIASKLGENIHIAELLPCGDTETRKIGTLNVGDSTTSLFCNRKVPRSYTESLIKTPGVIFTDAIEKTLTYKWPNSMTPYDFTHTYTNVAAKTAHISIDYGLPLDKIDKNKDFHVSTKNRLDNNSSSMEDVYEKTSLAEALKIAKVNFVEGEIRPPKKSQADNKKTYYGIKSIDGVTFNADRNAYWSIIIKNHNTPDEITVYTPFQNSNVLDSIFITSGDEILITFNEDYDGDLVPLSVEMLYGTSDNDVDSDKDSLSDREEIYGWEGIFSNGTRIVKTNPTKADTDDDGIRDDMDDDPLVRAPYTSNKIDTLQIINAYSQNMAKIEPINNISYKATDIHDSTMRVRIITEKLVKNIKIEYEKNEYKVTASGNEFNFVLPVKTSEKFMNITVTSEEGAEKTYTIEMDYTLDAPTNLQIHAQNDKKSFALSFLPPDNGKGSLIDGYIIVRGESIDSTGNKTLISKDQLLVDTEKANNNGFNNKSVLNAGLMIEDGLNIVAVLSKNDNSFTDDVGEGSPYYSYRVYAYRLQNNKTYLYSKGSNVVTKSLGRIKGYFQLESIGTEYLYDAFDGRYDMRVRADIYTGNKLLKGYNYWFRDAGNVWQGNTIYWEKVADDVKKGTDNNSIKLDETKYAFDIGKEGLSIKLFNHADVNDEFIDTKYQVDWPYERMADVLNGKITPTGKNDNAPLNNETNMFIWGDANVCFDYTSKCNIGDEPHSGYKIKFHYEWVD